MKNAALLKKVMLVHANAKQYAEYLNTYLKEYGYELTPFTNPEKAFEYYKEHHFDLVIIGTQFYYDKSYTRTLGGQDLILLLQGIRPCPYARISSEPYNISKSYQGVFIHPISAPTKSLIIQLNRYFGITMKKAVLIAHHKNLLLKDNQDLFLLDTSTLFQARDTMQYILPDCFLLTDHFINYDTFNEGYHYLNRLVTQFLELNNVPYGRLKSLQKDLDTMPDDLDISISESHQGLGIVELDKGNIEQQIHTLFSE